MVSSYCCLALLMWQLLLLMH
uniref:Uncharacterized protein n=1 Tax=Arundo donax TaxID=35708 RepID=A0A0A9HW82_ARUDO